MHARLNSRCWGAFWRALACSMCLVSASSTAWGQMRPDFEAAVRRDNVSALLVPLLRGQDVNATDAQGQTGLHLALRTDSVAVAQYLANLRSVDVNALNPQGESPLMLALLKGHTDVAKALIQRGADINKTGWTPLHYAATYAGQRATEQVRLLLEHHAYIDAESPNGTTPLMMAAQYGAPEVVRLLLQEGADASLRNQQNLTALDFARRSARPTSAEILLAHHQAQAPKGTW